VVSVHVLLSLRCLGGSRTAFWLLGPFTILVALSYLVAGLGAYLAFVAVFAWWWRSPSGIGRTRTTVAAAAASLVLTTVVVAFIAAALLGRSSGVRPSSGLHSLSSLAYVGYELILGRSTSFPGDTLRQAASGRAYLQLLINGWRDTTVAAFGVLGVLAIVVVGFTRLHIRQDRIVLVALVPWLVAAGAFQAYSVYPGFDVLGRQ
jgi:hypothetical protein